MCSDVVMLGVLLPYYWSAVIGPSDLVCPCVRFLRTRRHSFQSITSHCGTCKTMQLFLLKRFSDGAPCLCTRPFGGGQLDTRSSCAEQLVVDIEKVPELASWSTAIVISPLWCLSGAPREGRALQHSTCHNAEPLMMIVLMTEPQVQQKHQGSRQYRGLPQYKGLGAPRSGAVKAPIAAQAHV